MAEQRCECEATSILVFPCSGGSNVGQLANAAAVELTKQGRAKMYCLAGMGAHVAGMVHSAAGADYRIAIDGCAVACARKTLEHAGLVVDRAVVVTELGIAKNHALTWSAGDLERTIQAAEEGAPQLISTDGGCGCGCNTPVTKD
jgi:uncharacterized metal-binding protein